MGDDALTSEVDVVGALEEHLFGVWVFDEVGTVVREFWAEIGALEAGKPEGAVGNGGVVATDHFELKVGDNAGERDGRVLKEGAGAEASEFLRAEEGEDDSATGAWAGGQEMGEGEDRGGSGGVVVGAVVDDVAIFSRGAVDGGRGDAEVVEMGGEEDDLVL